MYTKNTKFTLAAGDTNLSGARTQVVALFSDLRGFSDWCETQTPDIVAALMKSQFERVIQICNDHHHHFHKFLGDGFLLLWEADEEFSIEDCVRHALDAAFHLHSKYRLLSRDFGCPTPGGYGVGISMGEAVRIQPETSLREMNEVDFVGYPLNCAARMQTLAEGYGTVVCATTARLIEAGDGLADPEAAGLRHGLAAPSNGQLQRAALLHGLRAEDRSGFRYVSFIDPQQQILHRSDNRARVSNH
ncbi:MAG: adenylate/guanylate cyclase domain-containing protein [Steroidobacteraceae bacterium]